METIRLPKVTCNRCGYKWTPRTETVPNRCAHCHSPLWNKPRKYRRSERLAKAWNERKET